MLIRTEQKNDQNAIFRLNVSSFETPAEANLVDALREHAKPYISLVAEKDEEIVGHIMFSPVSLTGHSEVKIMGLAPMAVEPNCQRLGIGSELVRAGLRQCTQTGFSAAVVLGHPKFYPRFGFSQASFFSIDSEYDVPDDYFMVLELEPASLSNKSGLVKYHDAFSKL